MQVMPNTRRRFRKSKWRGNGNRWCWSQLLQGLVWWAQKLLPKCRRVICAFKVQFLVWPLAAFWGRIDSGSNKLSSVAQSCPTLCDPMNRSTPGFPVHCQLLESTQTHVHRVGDVIQPSHPLLSPSPALNLSQHQGLFQWVNTSHQVAKVLEFQLQHQSFQWTPRTDLL